MHCICYEMIFMLVFWRYIMNQSKWRLNSFQFDCFITHNVFWSSSRSPSNFVISWTYRLDLRRLSPWPYFRSKRSVSCLGRFFVKVWNTVLYCVMVRNSLQKAVVVNLLLARNRFRTNYIATFLWDSSAPDDFHQGKFGMYYGGDIKEKSICNPHALTL